MTVVLRLEGLNAEAGSADIRQFFHGLHIPEGGVHIIGGHLGEAFILFTTDRDGQLAMGLSGTILHGTPISLHISSIVELKHKVVSRLQKQTSPTKEDKPTMVAGPQDPCSVLLPSVVAAIKGLQDTNPCVPGYLRLCGHPHSVTKLQICEFFRGLQVLEVLENVRLYNDSCVLVKLPSLDQAKEGLKYSDHNMGGFRVKVRLAHKKLWDNAVEEGKNVLSHTSPRGSINLYQDAVYKTNSNTTENATDKRDAYQCSPVKRCSDDCMLSVSPKRLCPSVPGVKYCIMVKNLSKFATKTEIKAIFGCHKIPNSKILHLLDEWRQRTDTAFIMFSHVEDYVSVMNMDGIRVGLQTIDVSSITIEKMRSMLQNSKFSSKHS